MHAYSLCVDNNLCLFDSVFLVSKNAIYCPYRGIDGCLLVEPHALVLVFIYQARLNAIYTAKLSYRNVMTGHVHHHRPRLSSSSPSPSQCVTVIAVVCFIILISLHYHFYPSSSLSSQRYIHRSCYCHRPCHHFCHLSHDYDASFICFI